MARRTTRMAAVGALIAGSIAMLFLVLGGTGSGNRRFSAVVPAAANIVVGQEINAAGKKVGSVTKIEPVDRGRAARIRMRIDDKRYWPLPRDSKLELRFGGTVSFSNRYLLLARGTRRGDPIPEGGELATANVKVPVEIDEVVPILNAPVRRDIRRLIGNSAAAFDRAGPHLNRALGRSAPVAEGASKVFQDLTSNRQALERLVSSTGRVVDAVDRSSPGVRVLLDGAARTFVAIAAEADDLEVSLERLPGALRQTRSTLARADVTLREAGDLTDRLAPGVEQLRLTAGPLSRALGALRDVAPAARGALTRVPPDVPPSSKLLDRISDISPRLASLAKQATTEVGCVRPYAPEITLLATTWGDYLSGVDNRGHYARATVQNYLPAQYNNVPLTAGEAAKIYPGMEYGFPRPPGTLAGQPWLQPQCGAGADALDPSKDQESAQFDRNQLPPSGGSR